MKKPHEKVNSDGIRYDPVLAQLFASSLGPTKPLITRSFTKPVGDGRTNALVEANEPELQGISSHTKGTRSLDDQSIALSALTTALASTSSESIAANGQSRKRKRRRVEDDVEGNYMRHLARDEARESLKKKPKLPSSDADQEPTIRPVNGDATLRSPDAAPHSKDEASDDSDGVPQHETARPSKDESEVEKSMRTVFLANVSTETIKSKSSKRVLMEHLASFIPELPKSKDKHAVESLRFRSTAFMSDGKPRKAAFATKDLMDSTTKSTNAYAVYTTQLAAREACKRLNGTMVLERHLRVDSVAHPAKQDHRRCVFVGNLGFVDDSTAMDAAKREEAHSKPQKPRQPADVEEGLWRHFGKAGKVESVRVVRDKTTRIGKGFAYVQFWDGNAVEKALLLNEKKFPPMLPRILRVTRAKATPKKAAPSDGKRVKPKKRVASRVETHPREPANGLSKDVASLAGRASKLLGRAGAAHVQDSQTKGKNAKKPTKNSTLRAEKFKKKAKQGVE